MGTKITKYSFIPKENEQIDAVITLAEEPRSVIHGVVKNEKGEYIKDAVVKLFRVKDCEDNCALKPITHTFTDECGQFIFGPLSPGKKYEIKIWVNDVRICTAEDTDDSDDDWEEIDENTFMKSEPVKKVKINSNINSYSDKYYL